MKIIECMSQKVVLCSPQETIQAAAKNMKEHDTGVLPVGENDRLVGMITDRDIVIRALAEGRGLDTIVRDAMSQDLHYCFDDEEIEDVATQMSELKVRRLPVLNRQKRLVGIVSLGDISQGVGNASADALSRISQPGGQHSQH